MHDDSQFINGPFYKCLNYFRHIMEVHLTKTFLMRCDENFMVLWVWALFFPVKYWSIEVKLLLFIMCYIFDSLLLIPLVCANEGSLKDQRQLWHILYMTICAHIFMNSLFAFFKNKRHVCFAITQSYRIS